jgi:hypothetical protein
MARGRVERPRYKRQVRIFVDESGTFTAGPAQPNSWCVIAAYVSPEGDRTRLDRLVQSLRLRFGSGQEVKISDVPESALLEFLDALRKLNGLLFAVAVDVNLHDRESVAAHQQVQASKILERVDTMLYEEGRNAVRKLGDDLAALPLQLYTQLQLQIMLLHRVMKWAPVYFVQHAPQTLGAFRWRFDRKDTTPTAYEDAFSRMLPAILQTISMRDPMIQLEGADYSRMERFEFESGKPPSYLKDAYGLEVKSGLDLSKIIREDFQFVDSAQVAGVQVADLCASALRRLFRGRIQAQQAAAVLLGANMLAPERGQHVIGLLSLGREGVVSDEHAELIRFMEARNRPFIA